MSATPAVIEEEPPHEFYASLLGKKIKTSRSEIVVLPPPLPQRDDSNQQHHHVVETSSLAGSSSCEELDDIPKHHQKGNYDTVTSAPTCSVYERARQQPMMLSSLALTSSNCKGFNLLTQMGWKEEDGGLGKHRQGTLAPVRPNGNQEQRGLGFAAKRRCRFEKPNVATVVKTTRAQRRRLRQQHADAEAKKLKQARMMLRTDVSDEYHELYRQLHPSG